MSPFHGAECNTNSQIRRIMAVCWRTRTSVTVTEVKARSDQCFPVPTLYGLQLNWRDSKICGSNRRIVYCNKQIDLPCPLTKIMRLDGRHDCWRSKISTSAKFKSNTLHIGLRKNYQKQKRTPNIQGGTKNGASLSHCKYYENSMTELRGNWWTSAACVVNFFV